MITPDSEFFRFTFHVLPWITYVIFIVGMIYQIVKWLRGASPETVKKSEGEPAKKSGGKVWGTIKAFILNLIVQRRMLRKNPNSIALWVISWILFHIALFAILFGHLRGFHIWYVDWFSWSDASANFLVKTLPYYVGFVLLTGVVLLLLRRLVLAAPRAISTLGNYIVLLLLLVVIVAGIMMRVLPDDSAAHFEVTVPPGFGMYLEHTPSLVWLTIHVLIGQIIFMYIPFSGLIHIIGSIITTIASALASPRRGRKAKQNVEIAR